MCLLNCARVNDHLHNSETRPRSPFDRLTSFVYPLHRGFQVFITTEWRIDAELS